MCANTSLGRYIENGWGKALSSLPVAQQRSSDVLLLSRLVIYLVHRRNRADDGLQEGTGQYQVRPLGAKL